MDENAIRQSPMWNHMTTVLSHVISERPQKALESLAPTSNYVLTGKSVPPKSSNLFSDSVSLAKSDVPVDTVSNVAWASNFRQTAAPPKPRRRPVDPEDEEEEPVAPYLQEEPETLEDLPAKVNDVVVEQGILNAVGTGVPPQESYRLAIGLQKLAVTEPVSTVRLWGKFLCSKDNYYIAETKVDPSRVQEEDEPAEDEEEEDGVPVSQIADVLSSYQSKRHHSTPNEEAGSGCNEFVYYAASSRDPTVWTKLPDVTTQQIVAARKIRSPFTGNLQATVVGHPKFPGLEKNYLRAQIARIQCSCRVAPRDIYVTEGALPEEEEDENGNIIPPPAVVPAYSSVPPLNPQDVPDEDDVEAVAPVKAWFTGYPDDELLQSKFWVHLAPTLLKSGRVTQHNVEAQPNAEGVEPEDPVESVELINPFLSDLSRDSTLAYPGHSRQNIPAWVFRKAFHNESSNDRTYVARSLVWPGAVTYAVAARGKPGAEYQMFYCGNGLKSTQGQYYVPQLPPRQLVEFPEDELVFQRDSTAAEEAVYAAVAPPPAENDEEEDE